MAHNEKHAAPGLPADMPPELVAAFQAVLTNKGPGVAMPAGVIPGSGVSEDENAFYKVYFGKHRKIDRGPALHADSVDRGPQDRGPAMHHDPVDSPWDDVRTAPQGDKMVDLDSALMRIYNDKTEQAFTKLLIDEGVVNPGEFEIDDVHQWWQKAVIESAKKTKHGDKKLTPQDWIEIYAGKNGIYGGGAGGEGGAGTTTHSQTSVTKFDDLDARASAEETYSAIMGRSSDSKEVAALKEALNAYAAAHPSISTSTTTNDGEGNAETSTVTEGGVSAAGAAQIAVDQARAEPDYAEYQAATTMFSWLQQALGSTADV